MPLKGKLCSGSGRDEAQEEDPSEGEPRAFLLLLLQLQLLLQLLLSTLHSSNIYSYFDQKAERMKEKSRERLETETRGRICHIRRRCGAVQIFWTPRFLILKWKFKFKMQKLNTKCGYFKCAQTGLEQQSPEKPQKKKKRNDRQKWSKTVARELRCTYTSVLRAQEFFWCQISGNTN